MSNRHKDSKKGHVESYEETIARAEKLTEEERMQLARKVIMAGLQTASTKK